MLPWDTELAGRLDRTVIGSTGIPDLSLPGRTGCRTASRSSRPPTRFSPSGHAPPCILVFVDAWTSYGGSQYVDSPGTGRYHSYLCDEVVPWLALSWIAHRLKR